MIDLNELHKRLQDALPMLRYERVVLQNEKREIEALAMESEFRGNPGDVYRVVVAWFDDEFHIFAHVNGESSDLSTKDAAHFTKPGVEIDEAFALLYSCWSESAKA